MLRYGTLRYLSITPAYVRGKEGRKRKRKGRILKRRETSTPRLTEKDDGN